MADEVIEADALGKVYPDGTAALQGVSLTVAAGEIFGCLGRNGAGKTTMIRILTTLATPTTGHARVCGHDVVKAAAAVRATIGVSLQQVALDDLMTAHEHLDFVARLAGLKGAAARTRIDELLTLFGLADNDKVVATYSGGMRRRLDIALTLIRQPRVLFLDEPTTGLDPQSRRTLWEWIRQFAAEGNTVLLTSQYLEEVDELADRVGVLHGGQMMVVDTTDGLKRSYGGRVLRVQAHDSSVLTSVLDGLGAAAVPEGRYAVRLNLDADSDLLDTLGRLRELGVPDSAIVVEAPTLEDVFLQLTGDQLAFEASDSVAAGVAAIQRSIATPGRGR